MKGLLPVNKSSESVLGLRVALEKKLNENIWEFRTRFNGMAYRLFAFWDREEKAMVIATHGIIKKTQKTPSKEIKKAEEIMKLYYKQKNENGKDENI